MIELQPQESPRHTVAIVDDRVDLRELLMLRLGMVPSLALVGQASNGADAVSLAREVSPDLMTLDLKMPIMGGAEAIPLLRAAAPRMRIVVYTSQLDAAELSSGSRPDAIVLKGANLSDLVAVVLGLLAEGPLERRTQSRGRVGRGHVAAVAALGAVSGHARPGQSLGDFYSRLTSSIAQLVYARKVLFWELGDDGTLAAIPGAHDVDDGFIARLFPVPCAPDRDDLPSRVVFHDHTFVASRSEASADFAYGLAPNVTDVIQVAWRAGDQRLGLVAAYGSERPDGFSKEDIWVLQEVGLAAGLVWQLTQREIELTKTIARLQAADTARRLLLKHVATATDNELKRLAMELHDDALQKLTAADLKLQRLGDLKSSDGALISQTRRLLTQTEQALRQLLFDARPPGLNLPGGFAETLRDRITMSGSLAGVEIELDVAMPDAAADEFKAIVYRQIAEALTNIEKHASATRVLVSLKMINGAAHGLVTDNGRGFIVSERDHLPGHLGLFALTERALLTGGWAKIDSVPGLGTTVEFLMPAS
ncbi:MAG: response regulator [Candidatus Dormibacteraeota bacterium]|nr:response regulator [Candidatus Dormibacteraeota bacterium]